MSVVMTKTTNPGPPMGPPPTPPLQPALSPKRWRPFAPRWPGRCADGGTTALLVVDQLFPPPPGRDAGQALLIVARDGTPLRAFPDRNHRC